MEETAQAATRSSRDQGEAQYGPRSKYEQHPTMAQGRSSPREKDCPGSNHPGGCASRVQLWDCEPILQRENCLEEMAG
jgi:hypothetical protein